MQSCIARQKYNPPNIKGSEPGTSWLSCSITRSFWNAFSRLSSVWKASQIKGCSVETLLLICPEISCAWKTRLWLLSARQRTDGFSYSKRKVGGLDGWREGTDKERPNKYSFLQRLLFTVTTLTSTAKVQILCMWQLIQHNNTATM